MCKNKALLQLLDGKHEEVGFEFLKNYFKPVVTVPIKLHVQAKRYLCRNKLYYDLLSNPSKISLKLQGGIMSHEESQKFTSMKFCRDVIRLRKYDDDSNKGINKIKKIDDCRDLIISQLLHEKYRNSVFTKAALL